MNNYAETKRIPLEHATKEELITGLLSIMTFDPREQAEKAIYRAREDYLIKEMMRLSDVMSKNLQIKGKPTCIKRRERWNSASRRWSRIYTQLQELQGL